MWKALQKLFITEKGNVRTKGFENVPRELYPIFGRNMTARQLSQLSRASPNFWRFVKTSPKLLGKIRAGHYQHIIGKNLPNINAVFHGSFMNWLRAPRPTANNKAFLQRYNIPGWRAEGFLRSIRRGGLPPMFHTPQFNPPPGMGIGFHHPRNDPNLVGYVRYPHNRTEIMRIPASEGRPVRRVWARPETPEVRAARAQANRLRASLRRARNRLAGR